MTFAVTEQYKDEAFSNDSSINGGTYDCSDESTKSKSNIGNDNN